MLSLNKTRKDISGRKNHKTQHTIPMFGELGGGGEEDKEGIQHSLSDGGFWLCRSQGVRGTNRTRGLITFVGAARRESRPVLLLPHNNA